ncbi:GNAT family N-acetyltransferase [Burkholderia cenocepacia]|uniref:GNAT family N-acetyltransferase n=1 Tax=Burkholderia pseudomultivorans TaxID=1207504 RepID=UPI001E4B45F7|nr:GNAT family N-acetyltransferase [Burkholderia pseudomultivorans]
MAGRPIECDCVPIPPGPARMKPPNLTTRASQIDDYIDIARLLRQLGYDSTSGMIREKLQALLPSQADRILVATIDQEIVGCISLHALPLFHMAGSLGRITSMVVDARCRGQGIGSALIAAAEHWFEQAGCVKLEVTSGDHRPDAHRFYARHGFVRNGQRLAKTMGS